MKISLHHQYMHLTPRHSSLLFCPNCLCFICFQKKSNRKQLNTSTRFRMKLIGNVDPFLWSGRVGGVTTSFFDVSYLLFSDSTNRPARKYWKSSRSTTNYASRSFRSAQNSLLKSQTSGSQRSSTTHKVKHHFHLLILLEHRSSLLFLAGTC